MSLVNKKIFFFLRIAIIVSIVLSTLLVGFIFIRTEINQAKALVLERIVKEFKQAEKKFGVELKWDNLSFSFVPLKATVNNVTISFLDNSLFDQPVQIVNVVISPNYWKLLHRAVSLSVSSHDWGLLYSQLLPLKVLMKKPYITITFNPKTVEKNMQKFVDLNQLFQSLPTIDVIFQQATFSLSTSEVSLLAESSTVYVRLDSSDLKVNASMESVKIGDRPSFSLSMDAVVNPDLFSLENFSLRNSDSYLNLSGEVTGTLSKKDLAYWVEIKTNFIAEDFYILNRLIYPDFQLSYSGKVFLDAYLQYSRDSFMNGQFDFNSNKLLVNEYALSDINAKGNIENSMVHFDNLRIKQDSHWDINFLKTKLSLKNIYAFQSNVEINDSQLHSLFQSFNLKQVPVFSHLNGRWKCTGHLKKFQFDCSGLTKVKQLSVHVMDDFDILKVPDFTLKGKVHVSQHTFTTDIVAEADSMTRVEFSSVLDNQSLDFSAVLSGDVNLNQIEDLVYLSPKGVVHINQANILVSTETVDIQSNLKLEDLVIDGFRLGYTRLRLHYTDKGFLHFRNIKGYIGKSHYLGNVSIDLFNKNIKVFADSSSINLKDLKYSLEDKLYFPFMIEGIGSATVSLNGPLQINAMNYSLRSQFPQIILEKEVFKDSVFHVESKKGHVSIQKIESNKGDNGKIIFTGRVDNKGDIKAQLSGSNLRLQNSKNFIQLFGDNYFGQVNFNMDLSGFFLNPVTIINLEITDSYMNGYPSKDSKLSINVFRDRIEVAGLVSDKLQVNRLVYPFDKGSKVILSATTKDLNIKQFFFSKGDINNLYNQFQSDIDSEIDLSYKMGRFFDTCTGQIQVYDLVLARHSHKIFNKDSFSIKLDQGSITIDPFLLVSDKQLLHVTQNRQNNIDIRGDIKVDFLQFLFPFIRTLEGDLSMQVAFKPKLSRLNPKGWIKLRKGIIELPKLDSFESVYSDMQINKNQLTIQSLYFKTGGGEVEGKGNMVFKSSNLVPVDFTGSIKKVQFLGIPDVTTTVSGLVTFKGDYFPYTLGITGNLQKTKIYREFASAKVNQVKVSSFIPVSREENNFEPITLALDFNFSTPIRVENSLMQSLLTGSIQIQGVPTYPLISGELVTLPNSKLMFRDHEFDVLPSTIKYNQAPPTEPVIDLRAKGIVTESSKTLNFNTDYNISLAIKGTGSNANFSFKSVPHLSESEIVSLLTFGVRSINFNTESIVDNINKYSYYQLGYMLFQQAINKELTNKLGLDQVLIIPYINQKTNSTAPKLILRKKIFDNLVLAAGILAPYEAKEVEATVKYNINKELSVVGFWKQEETSEGEEKDFNTLGVDLEYRFDF